MTLITRMRKQKAVYWAKVGNDAKGQPTYAAPVEIKVRWEDVNVQVQDMNGRTVISNARVYVDRETTLGGVLWKGVLVNINPSNAPFDNTGAREIFKLNSMSNFRNTQDLLIAYL